MSKKIKNISLFSIFGTINPPAGATIIGSDVTGLPFFISVVLRSLIAIAGIYAILNIILAGYAFISAGGDPKQIAMAWAKIWQSLLGLLVSAGAFVIAAIIGQILFSDPGAILTIRVFQP
jgi:hypothetical protein